MLVKHYHPLFVLLRMGVVPGFDNRPGEFLLALVGVDALAVEVILDAYEYAMGRTEVFEYPWGCTCQSLSCRA